jgi:hypothetical protein
LTPPPAGENIAGTAEVYVNQATVPISVAVLTCACGASCVQYDLRHGPPGGWTSAADGSDCCPRCASAEASAEVRRP